MDQRDTPISPECALRNLITKVKTTSGNYNSTIRNKKYEQHLSYVLYRFICIAVFSLENILGLLCTKPAAADSDVVDTTIGTKLASDIHLFYMIVVEKKDRLAGERKIRSDVKRSSISKESVISYYKRVGLDESSSEQYLLHIQNAQRFKEYVITIIHVLNNVNTWNNLTKLVQSEKKRWINETYAINAMYFLITNISPTPQSYYKDFEEVLDDIILDNNGDEPFGISTHIDPILMECADGLIQLSVASYIGSGGGKCEKKTDEEVAIVVSAVGNFMSHVESEETNDVVLFCGSSLFPGCSNEQVM